MPKKWPIENKILKKYHPKNDVHKKIMPSCLSFKMSLGHTVEIHCWKVIWILFLCNFYFLVLRFSFDDFLLLCSFLDFLLRFDFCFDLPPVLPILVFEEGLTVLKKVYTSDIAPFFFCFSLYSFSFFLTVSTSPSSYCFTSSSPPI